MHANARLAPEGRRIMCERIAAGRPVAHVAAEMAISRTTAYRWWRRYQELGEAGLQDRSQMEERLRAGSAWLESGLAFTNEIGEPLHLTA